MISCGIDIGSTTIEAVLLAEKEIAGRVLALCGAAPAETAKRAFGQLLRDTGIERDGIGRIVATGFGRSYFGEADRTYSEIACHATGVTWELPGARTVLEIGGQDSKATLLEQGGTVARFSMNDRCAAGTGRFIETVARVLGIPVEETGALAARADRSCTITSMCAVFAETEIVGLLHRGEDPGAILRGVFASIARRILGMLGPGGIQDDLVFTGGVALNPGVVRALEEATGRSIKIPSLPQFTGAIGAALLAGRTAAEAHSRMHDGH